LITSLCIAATAELQGMDAVTRREIFEFGRFRLDLRSGGLFRNRDEGQREHVALGSRALDVLYVLVSKSGELVGRDEIMTTVWPDATVEEANLTVQISALRRVLDQDRGVGSCIQTVAGRGYRFVPTVARVDEELPEVAAQPHSDQQRSPPRRMMRAIISSAGALVLLLVAGGWWLVQGTVPVPTATHLSPPPDWRMSTMIFPFENSSGDASQDGLAAEITRHVTERIARGTEGPVIAGMATGRSKGSPPDLHAIRYEHLVHFALTGSARRQNGHLIVSAILYDTAEAQPALERQVDLPDGPEALTTIGQVIYETWWQGSVDGEAWFAAKDHPDSLDKRDLYLMALATPLQQPTMANYQQRLLLVDRALAMDPNYFVGLGRRARLRAELVLTGYSSNPASDLAIATEAADHALAINPNSLQSLRVKATVLRARGDWTAAEMLLRRVLTLQPTEANRHSELGECLMAEGRHQEALVSFQTARQFAAGSDGVYWYDANIAAAYLALGQLDEAIATAKLAIGELPPDSGRVGELPSLVLTAATSLSGNEEAGRADLQKFLATPRSWHSMTEVQKWSPFAANPNMLDGLHRAGMPD
jgi:DNA-binding winged helix-turn-helix (wHTH) protein/TolB-like protein